MLHDMMTSGVKVACWSPLSMQGACFISHFDFTLVYFSTHAAGASVQTCQRTYKCGFHITCSWLGGSQRYSTLAAFINS